jgi:hypothetical protein
MTAKNTGLAKPARVEPPVVRAQRICDVCGGFDDHPRHAQWAPGAPQAVPSRDVAQKVLDGAGDGPHAEKARLLFGLLDYDDNTVSVISKALQGVGNPDEIGQGLIDLFDTSWILRHIDCCRAAGCPDSTCNLVLADAGNVRGDDLVSYITTTNPVPPPPSGDADATPTEG